MSKLFRIISSPRLAVVCLILLGILTFWGTLYQVGYGLDAAIKNVFSPWFITELSPDHSFPFIFVGAQLVMAVFLVNVSCALTVFFFLLKRMLNVSLSRYAMMIAAAAIAMTALSGIAIAAYTFAPLLVFFLYLLFLVVSLVVWFSKNVTPEKAPALRMIGLIVLHLGLVVLLGGGAVIQMTKEESNVALLELESTNVSTSYKEYEIAIWKTSDDPGKKSITSVSDVLLEPGAEVEIPQLNLKLVVDEYYGNCEAEVAPATETLNHVNINNIRKLTARKNNKEAERNVAGGIFRVSGGGVSHRFLLYGFEMRPHEFDFGDSSYAFILRKKRYPLPIQIKLEDVTRELHPNSMMAKEFFSDVELDTGGATRKVHISMNKPLRYLDYTFYQSGYNNTSEGVEQTVLSTVKTKGQFIPYVGTGVTTVGLLWIFVLQLVQSQSLKAPTQKTSHAKANA